MLCNKPQEMADPTVVVFSDTYVSLYMNYDAQYSVSELYRGVIAIVRLPRLASRALAL
jgi:hypothetical protein